MSSKVAFDGQGISPKQWVVAASTGMMYTHEQWPGIADGKATNTYLNVLHEENWGQRFFFLPFSYLRRKRTEHLESTILAFFTIGSSGKTRCILRQRRSFEISEISKGVIITWCFRLDEGNIASFLVVQPRDTQIVFINCWFCFCDRWNTTLVFWLLDRSNLWTLLPMVY